MQTLLEPIRHAISRGDWARSGALWDGLAGEVERRLRAGRLSPAEWNKVAQLFAWSRNVLLCARAQALDRLNQMHAAGAYRRTGL